MFDNVDITSVGLVARVRGVNIAAKASSVTAFGRPWLRDIGRWREKKEAEYISTDRRINL